MKQLWEIESVRDIYKGRTSPGLRPSFRIDVQLKVPLEAIELRFKSALENTRFLRSVLEPVLIQALEAQNDPSDDPPAIMLDDVWLYGDVKNPQRHAGLMIYIVAKDELHAYTLINSVMPTVISAIYPARAG